MPHGKRIAELLLNIGAVKISIDPPFTWSSGIVSPIYCDNRMVYSHPEARDFIADALTQRVRTLGVEPDFIAGTATAGIGWAALVADRMKLPFVYVRKETKGHGAKKRVEGDLPEGKDVVIIEDLFSTGGSAISSAEALRDECKSIVGDAVAIFTYELPVCSEKAQEARLKLHPLSGFSALLDIAKEQGRITDDQADLAVRFTKDPEGWAP